MVDIYQSLPISEKARCLAVNKAKARFVRDNFLRDRLNQQQQNLAIKVVKFSTLLTQQKLNQVKTNELKQFEKDMKQYCRVMTIKNNSTQQKKSSAGKISYFLEQIKQSTKINIIKDKKAKSQQKIDSNLCLQTIRNNGSSASQSKGTNPLQNIRIALNMEQAKQKNIPRNSLQLNGKKVSLHLLNLIQKLQQMQSIEHIFNQRNKTLRKGQTQENALAASSYLKKQQEKLSIDYNTASKFKPIGHITHSPLKQFQISKIQSSEKPNYIMNSSLKRKLINNDIKKRRKTQMASIRKYKQKLSLQIDEEQPVEMKDLKLIKQITDQQQNQKQKIQNKQNSTLKNSDNRIFKVSKKYMKDTINQQGVST